MNGSTAVELIRRPNYDGGDNEFRSLLKTHVYHVPVKGDVLVYQERVYIVHEVCWTFKTNAADGLAKVELYLQYDGEL